MQVLVDQVPAWPSCSIFEPSPNGPVSGRLRREARSYVSAVFQPASPLGINVDGQRNEDLERLTFPSESLDLVVTQDVFEHIWDPSAAAREVVRVLRPGGVHIFTVPVDWSAPTRTRAVRRPDGSVHHLMTPVHHGDPYSDGGALVVTDWGADVADLLDACSGVETRRILLCAPSASADPPTDVFVSLKPMAASPHPLRGP